MARSKSEYILATCFLSGIAAVLNLVALGTQQWVTSDLELVNNEQLSSVNYGLFYGVYEQVLGSRTVYQLQTTCSFSNNVCAMLCGTTQDARLSQLEKLYDGEDVDFDTTCPQVARMYSTGVDFSRGRTFVTRSTSERKFLNAGIWLSTLIFLILSALFGLVSAGLAVWNTVANPIEAYFNVFGLYIYNAIASVASLLVVILWGALFGTVIIDDVVILHTVNGDGDSSGLAMLGYSYWLNLVSVVLYACAVGVLYVRQYYIDREPYRTHNIEKEDRSDPNIYLY